MAKVQIGRCKTPRRASCQLSIADGSMDALKFLKRLLLLAPPIFLMLQARKVEGKKSKIVFLPAPVVSSQYFVLLQVAEEMALRDHMVRPQPQKYTDYASNSVPKGILDKDKVSQAQKVSDPPQYGMFDFRAPDGYLYLTLCAP